MGPLIRSVAFKPRSAAHALIARADRARDSRRWPEAATAYAEALSVTPDRADIWVQYGHALKESGRLKDAEAAYRKAVELQPTVADTHLQLGHVLKLRGRFQEAGRAYLAAAAFDMENPHAMTEIAHLQRKGVIPPA